MTERLRPGTVRGTVAVEGAGQCRGDCCELSLDRCRGATIVEILFWMHGRRTRPPRTFDAAPSRPERTVSAPGEWCKDAHVLRRAYRRGIEVGADGIFASADEALVRRVRGTAVVVGGVDGDRERIGELESEDGKPRRWRPATRHASGHSSWRVRRDQGLRMAARRVARACAATGRRGRNRERERESNKWS